MPDFVFTANAGLVFGSDIYLARFRHPQRQVETPHLLKWFDDQGFHVAQFPSDLYFEGAGDALFCGEDAASWPMSQIEIEKKESQLPNEQE